MHAANTRIDESPRPDKEPDDRERWQCVLELLRQRLRREQFETWFPRTVLVELTGEHARVAVHNGFTGDWLRNHYQREIEQALADVVEGPRKVEFTVDPERTANLPVPSILDAPESEEPAEAPAGEPAPASPDVLHTSDLQLNPSYRFDTFVVGPCNQFAHASCVGASDNPGRQYNPLFLHGNVGLGKTHLLQSLCHSVLERNPRARILFLSCESFVNHFISALGNGALENFRTKYRNVDVLVVDDIHILAGKDRTQEEFFHTFNSLYNAGKQIVLSSDSPPVDIPTLHERLVSRFKWGLVTEVEPPCYETRRAILERKSRERGIELPEDVSSLLAERIKSNIRELEGAVNRVLGFAALNDQPIDLQLVRQCLRELFATRRGQPSIEDVLKLVTDQFGVRLADLQSKKRTAAIAYARQVGMYLARRITRMSLEEIGGYFGGRDHSTVLYAVQKIKRLIEEDPAVSETLTRLALELETPSTL